MLVGGIYLRAGKHAVHVLEAEIIAKRWHLSEFDKVQIVMAERLVRASPKLQLLLGAPGLQ